MCLRWFIKLFLFILIAQTSYAQSTAIDNLLINANTYINSGNYNQANALLKDGLKQAEATKNKRHEAHIYDLLAEVSFKKREFKDFKLTMPLPAKLPIS